MATIDDVLDRIRDSSKNPDESQNNKEVGDKFERLILSFLRTDPTWSHQFTEVWLWDDWPGNQGRPDTGIDLVAQNADDEGVTAIQCKCYAPTTTLNKEDIDSFFTESGKDPFTHRIIACTTDDWSTHAENSLKGQKIPVRKISVHDLETSTIDWDKWDLKNVDKLSRKPRKTQRADQTEAIEAVVSGFENYDRGQLIMACGTGKTYTSQRFVEEHIGPGGIVLVLVPSISLLSQTLKEWTADASIPITPYAVCSDTKAGRRDNSEDISPYELVLPATTDPDLLVSQFKRNANKETLSVIFSTYQSTKVISSAQKSGIPKFDLTICDEAHRTTGVTLAGSEDSYFTRVHEDDAINSKKRLYMTATPRVFSDGAKGKAGAADAVLASMDDVQTFGPEFHRLGFNEAVERDLLTDYKVLVLAIDEEAVSAAFQKQLSDEDHELKLDDATRIVGCVNALSKRDVHGETFGSDDLPMQRAVAFSNTIAQSKKFQRFFTEVADRWNSSNEYKRFDINVEHVDGKFNSLQREALLRWLKEDPGEGCHILSNAKCLTEGIDVPALDSIMFLEPRNSMVDVIQAVGRVMRKSEGKNFGYVILPIGIPADETPESVLNDNKRFKVVWQVLNALRSHDERMNAVINKLDLNEEPPDMIEILPVGADMFEDDSDPESEDEAVQPRQLPLAFPIDELREGIYAKLVLKVGTRHYWEDWAKDVAEISSKHETRIKTLLKDKKLGLDKPFTHFVDGLHTIINNSITRDDAIGMLSQHLITKPIFDVLFEDYDFSASNPVSQSMQEMINLLDEHSLDKETESLKDFYDSVRLRVEGIDNAAGKQRIITELYEGFFSKAFPKAAESLGIVYTPIELVDFLLHATDHALRKHFDRTSMSDEGVNILDPFCGTGTFIVRLLQSGIIKPEDLKRKYAKELHSNELLLLAYYIAAINIESTYHDISTSNENEASYEPFNGVVLTDTFQLGETGEGTGTFDVFPVNNERASNQKGLGIRVIVGNPPYSAKQKSQNDDNANLTYPVLDQSIRDTYAAGSSAKIKNALYDSYVRAFRWSTNRIADTDQGGILAFVTNGGFIDSNSFDGFRKTLAAEFHHIYCYNLRGNSNIGGEEARQEGGNVFDVRVSIAITIFVREPRSVPESGAQIHYAKLDDYSSKQEKLDIIAAAATTDSLDQVDWIALTPNADGDWINQRSEKFQSLTPLFEKDNPASGVFELKSNTVQTNRDAWNYNSSRTSLLQNAQRMVSFFNQQVDAFHSAHPGLSTTLKERERLAKLFVDHEPTKFSWQSADYARVAQSDRYEVVENECRTALYRPFFKQNLNASRRLNRTLAKMPKMFPDANAENLAICLPPPGAMAPAFSVLMVNTLADMGIFWGGTQILSQYLYEKPTESGVTLFSSSDDVGVRDNITDGFLEFCRTAFDETVTKDSIFYYVYGMLHSAEYRATFEADLRKEGPRISLVKQEQDFWAFSQAGRDLADLHVNYEEVEPWPSLEISYKEGFNSESPDAFRIEKMRYPKIDDPENPGKKIDDSTTVIYNSNITISGIPESAHKYRIGSQSAVDWIIDRYRIRTHKDSGIVNDPNDWAVEHDDPTYILDLLQRIVTVSMKTNEIVAGLPKLKF